jgi:signal transduction histidine kinase
MQVLRDSFPADDERRALMGEVLAQVNRVDMIVHRLLLFTKLWTPARQQADLRSLVMKVIEAARQQTGWKHIQFRVEGAERPEAFVDPSLTEQVLWNVMENACDAMRDPAEPGAATATWTLRETEARVAVTLRDTGCGISPEAQEKLFRPFFTTKTYGTGLGLVICRRIMEAHGGSISVSGTPGKGTEVTLEFPKGN